MDDAFPADPPEPIPPETRARWAYWLDRGLLPDVTPDEAVAIWRRLLAALAEAERALASKIGADWREALPYETELELRTELFKAQDRAEQAEARLREVTNQADRVMFELGEATRERDQVEAQLAEVARSMVGHFQREHLEGDGPEIDRWKARLRAAVEALVEATKFFDQAYVGEDGPGTMLTPTSEEVEWRVRADAALRAAQETPDV